MYKKVSVEKFESYGGMAEALEKALNWVRYDEIVRPGNRVFVKSNLIYPLYKLGVTISS